MEKSFFYDTPIGKIRLTEENQELIGLQFGDSRMDSINIEETPFLKEVYSVLSGYFRGEVTKFFIPLNLRGTEFQKKVWNALLEIPYGETCSYGQIAQKIGTPKGARAVGGANNRNPIAIIVPCHRVIGGDGKLVGYAGGAEVKKQLIDLEKRKRV